MKFGIAELSDQRNSYRANSFHAETYATFDDANHDAYQAFIAECPESDEEINSSGVYDCGEYRIAVFCSDDVEHVADPRSAGYFDFANASASQVSERQPVYYV